jgi:fluoroacetyl-CoA thioesterase
VAKMGLVPGLESYVQIVVGDADTMAAMGTGDVPVLAIPRLLELADEAAVTAIAPSLEPGATSVSTSVAIEHKRPSPIGAAVVVWAELTEVDGQRLEFNFIARQTPHSGSPQDEDPVVAAGTLERRLVDRDRFAGPRGTRQVQDG